MQYDNWELIDFVRTIPNWKEIFKNEYFMDMREDEHFTLIDYNQIFTPICHLTNQCRGVIVDHVKKTIVRRGFYRFFNYGQPEAASLDLNNLIIEEKVDGSFIGVFWNEYTNLWQIGTRGTIDGSAPLQTPDVEHNIYTYKELFLQALLDAHERYHQKVMASEFVFNLPNVLPTLDKLYSLTHDTENLFHYLTRKFDKNKTYIFELVSKFNRIVVPYKENAIYYLRTIDNNTGEEAQDLDLLDSGYLFTVPKVYGYKTWEEILTLSKELPFSEEGYVVSDGKNKVKVKSPKYLIAHRLRGENVPTLKRYIELMRSGEASEFLSYFPEYAEYYYNTVEKYDNLVMTCGMDWSILTQEIEKGKLPTRKDQANFITKESIMPSLMFSLLDKQYPSVKDFFSNLSTNKLVDLLQQVKYYS